MPHTPIARAAVTRGAAAVACAGAAAFAAVPAQAERLVGLTTTNMLVHFDSGTPGFATGMTISGLSGTDERLLGIDLRPATGKLYGLSDQGRLYTLNWMTGKATFVAGLMADPADLTSPFGGLKGTSLGIDFNPVPDLGQALPSLRVVSNAGENLRINVNGAAAGLVSTDTALSGAASSVVAAAYSMNDRDATTLTALYGIDAVNDRLVLQNPPNDGTVSVIGPLGVDTTGVAGFDISGATGRAYASFTDGDSGKSALYRLDLASGQATMMGSFGLAGSLAVAPPLLDLTVAAIPEPGTWALMLGGLGAVGWLARRRRSIAPAP